MAIALLVGRNEQDKKRFPHFTQKFAQLLTTLHPDLDLRIYPDLGDYNEIDFAIVWRHPLGVLAQLPNLKCIASLGAGVDHILADINLPTEVPIVRIVDPAMSTEITQYVVATVLYRLKRFDLWADNQQQKIWRSTSQFNFLDKTVGILGLGFLGGHAAQTLHSLGIKVIGWSQSPKKLTGITHFTGAAELNSFLSKSDVLVCLLPLTTETTEILNAKNFARLPRCAYLINLGRGDHLVEADLLAALDSDQLSGACLDVFREEPLPPDHPFWAHPHIRVTPHIASVTNPNTVMSQIIDNYQRAIAGEPLLNCIDPKRGY